MLAVIYESRPNVTADAAALCLRSGNAAILRCGSDCLDSSRAIVAVVASAVGEAGLPADAVQLVPVPDREAVGAILSGLEGAVDLIIPRGGKSLVARVQAEAKAPVLTGALKISIGTGTKLTRRQAQQHRKMFKDDRASVEMFVGAGGLAATVFSPDSRSLTVDAPRTFAVQASYKF